MQKILPDQNVFF